MITHSIIQKSQLEGTKRLDAEYYQPEYLALQKNLEKTKSVTPWGEIEGKFITGPFGSEFNTENYVQEGKYRYVRGKDVKDFFPTDEDNVYVPKEDYERLKKYTLNEGDILVSVVGTPGIGAIVDATLPPAIFSCKSTVYRTKSINSFYFIAYLNSSYGRKLLERSVRGAVQTGLNIDDLRDLPVFLPSTDVQGEIGDVVRDAKKMLDESKSLYSQAEDLLLAELGLKNFKADEDLYSIVNFSDIRETNRMDAEYFQPKYERLVAMLKAQKARPLADVLENVLAKFNPMSWPDKVFRYVELSNIDSSIGIIDGYTETSGKEAPSRAKRVLKNGDVIVSTVEGSLGKVALVRKEQEGCLASTGFFQFRSKDLLPEVLLVIAKSFIFRNQLEQRCAGTILTAVPKESIKDILVPILPKTTQEKIAELVRESHEARNKAKELLEEAKRKVEELIENNQKVL